LISEAEKILHKIEQNIKINIKYFTLVWMNVK
jgi:hypothetical protein